MNFKDKSCLILDNGLFCPLAELLAPSFGRLGYYVDWQSSFPDARELIIGNGLDGIERVKYLWDVIDEFDLIVFPDCTHGDLQEYLRAKGKRIWGAGKQAQLELARWKTKGLLTELGLPVNESEQIYGIDNLRAYLKEHEDVYVKISTFRGLGETFHSQNYDEVKGQLDEFESRNGALATIVDFVVEKAIPDAREIGSDSYCIDGEFPNKNFVGVEVKDKAYFGKLVDYDELPDTVKDINTKLSYHMDGYRQFWSTEVREKDGVGYLVDITARQASPAGETFCHAFTNLPDILWNGAEGKLVHSESSAKFVAQIILCSEWAESHWQLVEFPDEIRPFVKLYNHCRIDGKDYVVPQIAKMKQLGSVIGLGNTADEACKAAKERAGKIKGYDLEAESDALDKAMSEMEGSK
jgi:hypothetical protein